MGGSAGHVLAVVLATIAFISPNLLLANAALTCDVQGTIANVLKFTGRSCTQLNALLGVCDSTGRYGDEAVTASVACAGDTIYIQGLAECEEAAAQLRAAMTQYTKFPIIDHFSTNEGFSHPNDCYLAGGSDFYMLQMHGLPADTTACNTKAALADEMLVAYVAGTFNNCQGLTSATTTQTTSATSTLTTTSLTSTATTTLTTTATTSLTSSATTSVTSTATTSPTSSATTSYTSSPTSSATTSYTSTTTTIVSSTTSTSKTITVTPFSTSSISSTPSTPTTNANATTVGDKDGDGDGDDVNDSKDAFGNKINSSNKGSSSKGSSNNAPNEPDGAAGNLDDDVDDPTASTNPEPTNVGMIVGLAVGAIVLLTAIVAFIFWRPQCLCPCSSERDTHLAELAARAGAGASAEYANPTYMENHSFGSAACGGITREYAEIADLPKRGDDGKPAYAEPSKRQSDMYEAGHVLGAADHQGTQMYAPPSARQSELYDGGFVPGGNAHRLRGGNGNGKGAAASSGDTGDGNDEAKLKVSLDSDGYVADASINRGPTGPAHIYATPATGDELEGGGIDSNA